MTSEADLLSKLDAADDALGRLAGRPREVRIAEPPWWPGVQVVDVLVRLPHKPVHFRYAVATAQVVPLGSTGSFATVNALAGLHLEQSQVASYLRFFLDTSDRMVQVVERPEEPFWFASADTDLDESELKSSAQSRIHPIAVTQQGEVFRCELTAIDYRELLEATYEVTPDGRVELVSRAVLMEGLPVPYVGV